MNITNNFMNALKNETNFKETENKGIAHKTTNSAVYDMFALGGAYRSRSQNDIKLLFKNAYEEDKNLALKCLFYLRDIRGGQGERKFFRLAYNWLCDSYPEDAKKVIEYISEYGRWDDLIYATIDTKLENDMFELIKKQFILDLDSKTPSLLGKWMPSENASSYVTRKTATKIRKYLDMTHKDYRKALSSLRTKINIVEKLMSENKWNEIEFDKIPSKAGLIYKNAFARRDLIAKKYKDFIKSENTKVNAKDLYPYEIVDKALKGYSPWSYYQEGEELTSVDRITIEKYWNNLPDYFAGGKNQSIMCVVDTSGSMTCNNGSTKPINIAISLGIYAGERCTGPFKNHYISFASKPQLIKIEGIDFVDKVERIYRTNLCDNTNLTAVFDLLKNTALKNPSATTDMPDTLIVISDMEIDSGSYGYRGYAYNRWTKESAKTEMEKIREEYAAVGLKMPKLVYWNVDARSNTILDSGDSVSFVSGASPVLFKQVCKGVTGYELMLDKLLSKRYEAITLD